MLTLFPHPFTRGIRVHLVMKSCGALMTKLAKLVFIRKMSLSLCSGLVSEAERTAKTEQYNDEDGTNFRLFLDAVVGLRSSYFSGMGPDNTFRERKYHEIMSFGGTGILGDVVVL